MNSYKYLIALLVLFFTIPFAKATHIQGGDISYLNIGQDSFLVTLTLFRDCGGVSAPTTVSMNLTSTCGGNITPILTKQNSVEISQLCPAQIPNSTCNGGTWSGVEQHTYTGIVVLSTPCNTWTMSWSSCCRSDQISNLINPGSLSTYLFAKLNSQVDSTNSSPYFSTIGSPVYFINTLSQLNLGAVDPDGDSLRYFLSPGFEDATTLVPYMGTYTFAQPLPGANAILDSFTGQLSFTGTATGLYSVAIRVEEYDRSTGIFLGLTLRDFLVNIVNSPGNNQPSFSTTGMINLGDGILSNGVLNLCKGDSLDVNITMLDSDVSDNLSVVHNVFEILDSTAIVTLSGTNPLVANVKWKADSHFLDDFNLWFQVYDDGCPFVGTTAESFSFHIQEGAYAGINDTICNGDSIRLEGSGGTSFVWSVISGSQMNTSSSCSLCPDPIVYPNMTTTYRLISNSTGACGNIDTVVVNVASNFVLDVSNDTIICNGDSVLLLASVTPQAGNYIFQWSGDSSLSSYNSINPICKPLDSVSYSVFVSNSLGCEKSESVNVGVTRSIPSSFSILGDSIVCLGGTVNMEVSFPTAIPNSCGTISPVNGIPVYGIIGDSSLVTTTNSFPSVYGRFYWGIKHQILYTASELHAMGLVAGNSIRSMAFDVATVGSSNNMDNLTIKMGCTNLSALSGVFVTGLSTVVPAHQYYPVLGWNTHQFSQDYVWDGISNLVVEICSNNSNYSAASTSTTRYSVTSNQSVLYDRGDNLTICSSSQVTSGSSDRPNTKFGFIELVDSSYYNYSWSPVPTQLSSNGLLASETPLSDITYNVTVSDSVGICSLVISKGIQVVTAPFDASFIFNSVICKNDGIQLFLPVVSGGIFTGVGVDSNGVFDPNTAGVGQWPINYNIPTPALCSSDSTQIVEVIDLPDATIDYVEVCQGSGSINLTAATPGGVWSGSLITDSINGTFDPTGLSPGSYNVVYTLDTPCYNADTMGIKIIEPYSFNISTTSIRVCENDSIDISSFINLSNSPLQGSQPMITYSDVNGYIDANGIFDATGVSVGNYVVTVGVSDSTGGCEDNKNVIIEVKELNYAQIIDEPSYCISQNNAKIFVQPWLYGVGASYSQRPLGTLGINDTLVITPFGQNGQFNPQVQGAGSWEITLTNVNIYGCVAVTTDTIYVLDSPDTSVTNLGLELIANAGQGYVYQWLDCDDNMNPISGANSAIYAPGRKGSFAVEVKAGNCIETSNCHDTWPLGVIDVSNSLEISIYPNPVEDFVTVSTKVKEELTIEILDNTGKRVYQTISTQKETKVSMTDFATGVYLIKVTGEQTHYSEKVVKN